MITTLNVYDLQTSLPGRFHRSCIHKKSRLAAGFLWWALRGSNSRPSRCKRDALPAELSAHRVYGKLYTRIKSINQAKNYPIYIFFDKLRINNYLYKRSKNGATDYIVSEPKEGDNADQ